MPEEDRVFYQEIDIVLTQETLITVRKTPLEETPFDPLPAREACRKGEGAGLMAYHLIDEIAERYLHLVDALHGEIDELEDHVGDWSDGRTRARLSQLRRDMLRIRRSLRR